MSTGRRASDARCRPAISAATASSTLALALALVLAATTSAGSIAEPASATVADYMSGVACPPGQCIAIGGAGTHALPQAWTLSRGLWSGEPLSTGSASGSLSDVSCTVPTACVAVGHTEPGGSAVGLAVQLTSSGWSPMILPPGIASLTSVSCVSPLWCMAVGTSTAHANGGSVALVWNGTSWNQVATSTVTFSTGLSAVSCASSSFCIAVGTGGRSVFAENWNGATWAVTSAPPQPQYMSSQSLTSVSCTSATFCLAVGVADTCCGGFGSFALTWNGSSWTNVVGGDGLRQVALGDISCASPLACVAVGVERPPDLARFFLHAVVVRWTGSVLVNVPLAAVGQTSMLARVSCPRPAWCAAVGSFTTTAGSRPLVERWNGVALARMWAPQ